VKFNVFPAIFRQLEVDGEDAIPGRLVRMDNLMKAVEREVRESEREEKRVEEKGRRISIVDLVN
jgi:hypothetical protein